MKLIRPVRGDDVDLRAGPLAVFGAVRIFHDGEFAHGINSEQLPTETSRRVVHFRSAGEFDAVEQKQIFLRPAARDGKHVADDGVRRADAAGALRRVIHDARIQRQQLIVASAVERQIFDLPLADQSGNVLGRDLKRTECSQELPPFGGRRRLEASRSISSRCPTTSAMPVRRSTEIQLSTQ